ncbi:carboxymuconolactone decarboxylase family protein [Agromyces fucosus]|uniref:Carboxymuconolactone decarboxylase family protein n=1 Tax=Agromyces fucosus TaxID=41985 RepID=A0A4Q2JL95_9MICO|nr:MULTISPECIES: carboxymuconolactone decarboxylase family protein [Agromyces]KQZ11562.1 carboxymuconolactone decarboxylase [Agromyces sp. Root1464]RXZ48662.1 carboxymuconolactone decarboxylase family protein [Agromyces fucosus]
MTTTQTRIPPTELTGVFGTVVKIAAKRMIGRVPDSMGVLAHHPALMRASMGIGRKIEALDELDENLASYAVMATAAYIGCSWCLDFNYYKTHNEGLDEEKARQVPVWREASVFTPLERQVMEYAEAMSQTPPSVTDELSASLLDALGPAALIELSAKVAFMNMSSRLNISLGIHSEGYADACEMPPLATRADVAASVVGSKA